MPFKLNISEKGKAWRMQTEAPELIGKSIGDKINGSEINSDLSGYEFEIKGASDIAGFPSSKNVEGVGLKKLLLKKGWGMRESFPQGLRRRKTVRGKVITEKIIQINLNTIKEGGKTLAEIFPDQNKKEEAKVEKAETKATAQEVAA